MQKEKNYSSTIGASFAGYIVEAITCTFTPLLYVRFHTEFAISYSRLAFLALMIFIIQLGVDLVSSFVVDRIGYRRCIITAHFLAAFGLSMMAWLPQLMDAYAALLIASLTYSLGCGQIEVLVSPLVEACPTKRKAAAMNLLHSFFCWGEMLVVLGSTLFFRLAGIENWRYLSLCWAVIPFVNGIVFLFVPMPDMHCSDHPFRDISALFKNKLFWLMFLMILCGGAAETAVSQWASALAETALGVTKTQGDLAGLCMFALAMGLGRVISLKYVENSLKNIMLLGGVLCTCGYLMIALSPWPVLSLAGCAVCGYGVSVAWPGTYSLAARTIGGTTALFSLLALGGDVGCSVGPYIAGLVATARGDDLQAGILSVIFFPIGVVIVMLLIRRATKNKESAER